MYLVKRLCNWWLQKTAVHFLVESYGVLGQGLCTSSGERQAADQSYKWLMAQVEALISQQNI